MFKKTISTLLSITLALTSAGVAAFAEETTETETIPVVAPELAESGDREFFLDFNMNEEEAAEAFDDNFGFYSSGNMNAKIINRDEANGKAFYVTNGDWLLGQGTPYEKGLYFFSMDFRAMANNEIILQPAGKDISEEMKTTVDFDVYVPDAMYLHGKNASVQERMNQEEIRWKTFATLATVELKENEWHSVQMYLDTAQQVGYYVMDNKFIAKDDISAFLEDFYGVNISIGSHGYAELDNVTFCKATYPHLKALQEKGLYIPEDVLPVIEFRADTNLFGNNYLGTNKPKFEIKMKNHRDTDAEIEVTYRVKNLNGLDIFKLTEMESFKPGEERIFDKVLDIGVYGTHTLDVTLRDTTTNEKHHFITQFACARLPEAGLRNVRVNVQSEDDSTHFDYRDQIFELYEKSGFYGSRESMSWYNMEQQEGVWKSDRTLDWKTQYMQKEDGLKMFVYMLSVPTLYGLPSTGFMPETQEQLDAWARYVKRLATLNPNIEYYELWNEPNNGFAHNEGDKPLIYTKLLEVTYNALKSVRPDAKLAGCSYAGVSGQWIEQVIKYGGGKYMDAVTIHPYAWSQSPEGANQVQSMVKVREMMDSYDLEDVELWYGEGGWMTNLGLDVQANYTIRLMILNDALGRPMERFYFFRYTDDDVKNREGFGYLDSVTDKYKFLARPVFCATTSWNDLMTDAKFVKTTTAGEVQLHQFKTRKGEDVLAYWVQKDGANVSVDLGCDTVIMRDMYGNEETLHGVKGKFSFKADINPRFIVGKFNKVEPCDTVFEVLETTIKAVKNDKNVITVTNAGMGEYEVEFTASENISAPAEKTIKKGESKLVFEVGDIKTIPRDANSRLSSSVKKHPEDTYEAIEIKIKKGDKLYYKTEIIIDEVPSVSYQSYVTHFAGDRWEFAVQTTNNTFSQNLTGKIEINAPSKFAQLIPSWNIEKIAPGATRKTSFPIPDLIDKNDLDFDATLKLSDGSEYSLAQSLTFEGVPRLKMQPTIDGKIGKDEWNMGFPIFMNETSGTPHALMINPANDQPLDPYGGAEDLSAVIYLGYDSENFYMAAEVTDDVHMEDPEEAKRLWAGDSFQLAFAEEGTETALRTDLQIGLRNNEPAIERSSSLITINDDWIGWFKHELAITRDEANKKTYYEFMIPFTELYSTGYDVKKAPKHYMSFLLNDRDVEMNPYDGNGRELMFEYGSGIGFARRADLFKQFNLMR